MESKISPYKLRGIPWIITIHGQELFYKYPPLKNNIYVYRCRKGTCKYFIKIDKSNVDKFINNKKQIKFTEINENENLIDKN